MFEQINSVLNKEMNAALIDAVWRLELCRDQLNHAKVLSLREIEDLSEGTVKEFIERYSSIMLEEDAKPVNSHRTSFPEMKIESLLSRSEYRVVLEYTTCSGNSTFRLDFAKESLRMERARNAPELGDWGRDAVLRLLTGYCDHNLRSVIPYGELWAQKNGIRDKLENALTYQYQLGLEEVDNAETLAYALSEGLIYLEKSGSWEVPVHVLNYISSLEEGKSLEELKITGVEVISKEEEEQEVIATIDGFLIHIKQDFYAECIIDRKRCGYVG